MLHVVTALLAFGGLAFGAVYPWAYWPLAIGVVAFSAAVLMRRGSEASPQTAQSDGAGGTGEPSLLAARLRLRQSPGPERLTEHLLHLSRVRPWEMSSLRFCLARHGTGGGALLVAVAPLAAGIAVQLIPLPQRVLGALAPGADRFLSSFDLAYALAAAPSHALSVDPGRTAAALLALLVLVGWAAAVARLLARPRVATHLVRNVAVLGTLMALVGVAQQATFNGKLLWFWEPTFSATNSFGPFVNRNHFAGWMLLAFALTGGYLVALLHRETHRREPGMRNRLLWLGSRSASAVILTTAAAATMAVSLIWTLSRSGIAGAAVALAVLAVAALRRASGMARKVAAAGLLALALVTAVVWKGTDTVWAWYGNTGTLEWRFTLWRDSLAPLRDFWITGAGLNTYGTLMLVYPRTDLSVNPRQAHNDYLQLAIEGGLLVGLPALLLTIAVVRQIGRRLAEPQDEPTWWIRMGAVAAICGIAVQELSEFSLQIPGVALLFATCVAIAIHEPARVAAAPRSSSLRAAWFRPGPWSRAASESITNGHA